jgi:putative transcriptional regulator
VKAHPADELLAAHAAGRLHPAPDLVLAAHLLACAQCREVARRFESLGGALMAREPPAPLAPDSLGRTFGRIEAPAPSPPSRRDARSAHNLPPQGQVGPRRWFGPGRWVAPVHVADQGDWSLHLVRAPASARLPRHRHAGPEYTCVLEGAFHDGETWSAGDFVATASEEHQLEVTPDGPCLCLIACQGGMKWSGAMKFLAPVLRV